MCQLYLYVEGQTEQVFATNVLAPYLANHGVYLMGPVLAEISRRKRGGVLSYEPFRNGLRNLLKQHHRPGVWFSSMIDLYSLPKNFPEWEKAAERRNDPNARVTHLEEALASDIGDRRFIPYIQLHEFEALLFADPASLALHYAEKTKALESLQAITAAHTSPELIDDGATTAPSKRIIAAIPAYEGAKRVVGPEVAELIGLDILRAKCPHFRQWVDRLAALAQTDDKIQ